MICLRSSEERARLEELAAAGEDVALVLAGQTLSGISGSELLEEARRLHPHTKRGLLIPWGGWGEQATGDAIFDSIARGRIDHYVLRPQGSPDELFHQAVSSMLLEWTGAARRPLHDPRGGRVLVRQGLRDPRHAPALRDSALLLPGELERRARPPGRGRHRRELPVILLPDGTVLTDPSNAELASAAGSPISPQRMDFDLVIVGAGPAGLSAAVYGASEGFSTLVVDSGGLGGQATSSSLIRNYLGFPRRERTPPRPERVRAGMGLRRQLRLHAEGDRAPARGR